VGDSIGLVHADGSPDQHSDDGPTREPVQTS